MSSPSAVTAAVDIKKIASLARLELTPEEMAAYAGQLGQILEYVHQLDQVDTSGVEATAHPAPVTDVTRPDAARPGLGPVALLANAPRQALGQLQVPKVVDAS